MRLLVMLYFPLKLLTIVLDLNLFFGKIIQSGETISRERRNTNRALLNNSSFTKNAAHFTNLLKKVVKLKGILI